MASLDSLIDWFEPQTRVIVALSGGVDSALVAYAAYKRLGDLALAVTADYKTLSAEELDSAKRVCREIGIRQTFLDYDELENDDFARNGSDRCFHCRMELGGRLAELARRHGASAIVDGTNTDDLGDYRPGIEALRQNGIKSPLVESGFDKSDVRRCAKSVGLSVHDRPSNSCLASRIPWGQRVTAQRLARIEMGEIMVRQLTGARQVRVRDMDGLARIEVDRESIPSVGKSVLDQITSKLLMIGFKGAELDPRGYRQGSISVIAD